MLTMRLSWDQFQKLPSMDEKRFPPIISFNKNNKMARKIASVEEDRKQLSKHVSKFIIGRIDEISYLSKNVANFNHREVVEKTVDELMQKIAFESLRDHIHYAPTQSGKSAFKAVKICAYLTMNMPVIVITKGKSESIELQRKISGYLKHYRMRYDERIFSCYGKKEAIENAFLNTHEASVLIIPDTYQKIQYAHGLLYHAMVNAKRSGRRIAGCALILDEVDAIIDRSEDQDEENETALKKLMKGIKPCLVMVTATPIPVFMKHLDKNPIITSSNKKIINYIGVEDKELVDDLDQESVYNGFGYDVGKLTPKYICNCKDKKSSQQHALFPTGKSCDRPQPRRKFPDVWKKKDPKIPRVNSQMIKFLRQEICKKDAKGNLTLIDTCPYVDGNKNLCIFHQASGIQDYFFSFTGKKVIVIVVHREKVFYRLPGHKYGFECMMPLGTLIDAIDKNKKYGLKMPIIVCGYYAMKRSRSFRSSERVPTSMIMCLGKGQSNENCRQAIGRASFNGRNILQRNRKTSKIKILCPREDFEMIKKHDRLVVEIIKLYKDHGMSSWKDISSELLGSSKNYYLHSCTRRTGNYIPGQAKKGKKRNRKISFPKRVVASPDNRGNEDLKLNRIDNSSASTISHEVSTDTNDSGISLPFPPREIATATPVQDIEGSPKAEINSEAATIMLIGEKESAASSNADSSLAPLPKKPKSSESGTSLPFPPREIATATQVQDIEGSPKAKINSEAVTITLNGEKESAASSNADSSLVPLPKKPKSSESLLKRIQDLKHRWKKTQATPVNNIPCPPHTPSHPEEIIGNEENSIRRAVSSLSGSGDSVSTEEPLCSDSTPIQDVYDSPNSPALTPLVASEVVAKLEEGDKGEESKIEPEVVPIKAESHPNKKRKRDGAIIARNDIIDLVDGDDEEDAIDLTLDHDEFFL